MNQSKSEILKRVIGTLETAERMIAKAFEEEQDRFDRMRGSAQNGELYERLEYDTGKLQEAADCIEEAIVCIEAAQ